MLKYILKKFNTIANEIYVGSTIVKLCERMAKHRCKMNKQPSWKLYQHMLQNGVESFYIELIEKYPCGSIEELRAREGEWINKIGTLNHKIAGRDSKQWFQDNREEVLTQQKEYNEKNQERIKQQRKEHRENNIEDIREYDRQRYKDNPEKRKANVKQWRDRNPEYASEYGKKCTKENKARKKEMDKLYREKKKEMLKCECGCVVQNFNLKKHQATAKHIELIEQKLEN